MNLTLCRNDNCIKTGHFRDQLQAFFHPEHKHRGGQWIGIKPLRANDADTGNSLRGFTGARVEDVMHPLAEEKEISVARLALAWLLHQKAVTTVIIGAKKIDQLNDNLKATEVNLSEDDLQKLNEVSQLPREYPGWMFERQGGDRKQQQEKNG